jgi:hypothetical protein
MNGLVVSSPSPAARSRSTPAFSRRQQRLPRLEHLLRGDGVLERRARLLLDPALLLKAGHGLLQGLEVGEDQLGVDGLDVRARRDLAVDVDDVAVLEGAHDLADGVGLTDVGEELVAEPLPLGGTTHDAGDVDERHRRGQDLLRPEDLGEPVQPIIGQRDDPDVRARWSRTGSSRRGRCSSSAR